MDGNYEFLVDGHTLKAGAGSLLYVPKGILHAHENLGEGVGRMLLTQTPGGLYELFFEKAGRPADGDDGEPSALEDLPDAERRTLEIAAEHGTEIPPPRVDYTWRPPAGKGHASGPQRAPARPAPPLLPALRRAWRRNGPSERCQFVQLIRDGGLPSFRTFSDSIDVVQQLGLTPQPQGGSLAS